MKVKNFFMMAAVASMALTACNNDEDVNKGGDPTVETGEATTAVFNIQISQGGQTKAATPAAGDENAIQNEAKVENAGIYIFKWSSETSGVKEVMVDNLAATLVGGTTNEWHIPAQALMLTSGKKHVIAVTNMSDAIKTKLATAFNTSYEAFYKAVVNLGAGTAYTIDNLFLATSTTPSITMSGENDVVLQAGVSQTEAEQETNSNHVTIYVDRLPAKIDVALAGKATALSIPTGETPVVGEAKSFSYDTRNMKREENVMKNITGTFVNTPWSDATDWVADPFNAVYTDRFFPVVTNDLTFPKSLLTVVGQESGVTYLDYVSYMPENTNQVARKGTSSYVAMKASYVPATNNYVSGYTNDATANNVVKLTLETVPVPFTADQYSLFNYDYNIAFKAEATIAAAKGEAYLEALAAYQAAQVEDALKDIQPGTIKFIKTAAYAAGTTVAGFNEAESINSTANKAALAAVTSEPTLWVKVDQTTNASSQLEQLQITAAYYWAPTLGGAYVMNEGVDFGTLTCGVYTTDTDGLKCYYRVNIFDKDLGTTNMMYYSVVRNYSYHLTIDKINSIGYPTQIDLVVDPDEPLNNNTFVQAHIVINKWTAKTMNTELGM